jgi:hypothetical protein
MVGAVLLLGYATDTHVAAVPQAVDAFARARSERNVEAALASFTDNAVARLERGSERGFVGRAEIKQFLEALDSTSPPVITATPRLMSGTMNTITWSERDQQTPPRELTGEAVLVDGKIKLLVYRARILLPSESSTPATITPLSTVALFGSTFLFAVGLISLSTLRVRRVTPSSLQGHLVPQLRTWSLRRRGVSPSTP